MTYTFRLGTGDESCWKSVYTNDEYRVPKFTSNDTVLDIGLNIGAFTMKAWDQGSRSIYSFEACPQNIAIANMNVGALEGVHLYHKAVVGDHNPDFLPFPVGNNSFFIQEHETVDVETITLHELICSVGNVRYLKIDVEGSEWEILYSLPDVMFRQIQEIIGEYHQPSRTYWGLRQNPRHPNYDYLTLQQYLQDVGFHTQFRPPTPPPMSGSFHAVRI